MKIGILLVFVFLIAAFVGARSPVLLQGADFPHFYCAARMLADGHGRQLYDADLQRQYQARYAGRIGTLYTHPPFEAVLYLSVARLPLKYAYLAWSVLSMGFLALAAERFAKAARPGWDWRLSFLVAMAFVPSLICVLQGQDSLLLLLLVVLAFAALRRRQGFDAGCLLALALFKFQLTLPLALVLAFSRRGNVRSGFVKGFSLVAAALVAVSIAISGWPVVTLYPEFLLRFKEQPFAGLVPQAMANFRGLTYLVFRSDHSFWAVTILSILTAAALVVTLKSWKNARVSFDRHAEDATGCDFDLTFGNTLVFALLVSYHLNSQDLALLLLPLALLLHYAWPKTPRRPSWTSICLLGILFLPPLHLWVLQAGIYALMSLPVVALFLINTALARQSRGQ